MGWFFGDFESKAVSASNSVKVEAELGKNKKMQNMFPLNTENLANTRHYEKFFVQLARTEQLNNLAITFFQ